MKEQIRPLISILEQDPGNEDAFDDLLQLVTGEEAENRREELAEELERGRVQLVQATRFEAACRMVDLEIGNAGDQPDRVLDLLREQARLYDEELFDQETAIALYKKSLESGVEHDSTARKIEEMETERSNWQQIVETFKEQAETATEASLKAHMLYSAAERTYKNDKTNDAISALLYEALNTDQTHLKAARLLEKILKEGESWKDLAELYATLAEYRKSKEERIQMLLSAARVCLRRLEDPEQAAAHYADVLDLSPSNQVAMRYLVQHYEEKEDWDHLVAVYEDGLAGHHSREEEVAMLMQAGMLHWRMRENPRAAEAYFKRLRKIEPAHEGMINFYRSLAKETGDNKQLLQVLSDGLRATDSAEFNDQLTKEIAQLAAGKGGNVERAIDAWKSVLRKEPDHDEAKRELRRLYREGEKWNALLDLLKSDAEALPAEQVKGKVEIYEEIVKIYRDQLSLGTLVVNTYKTILAIDPENEAAREALSETYRKEGRWNDLIVLLTERAKNTEKSEEKIGFLLRVANLWIERFNNFNRAVGPLEEVLSLDPVNEDATEILRSVYKKRRAWRPLLQLMEKEVGYLEGQVRRDRLVEMAQLAVDRLSDYGRAIGFWKQALDIDPQTPDALTTLEKLAERSKDWETLCAVLEMRFDREQADDQRIAILTKLGLVYKDRLKDPVSSAGAWKRILEIQPDHAKSMRSLKEAHLAAQDWDALEELYSGVDDYEGLVEVLGIAADRISDNAVKKALSFRCAELYDDPINQPDRALRHYERVLLIEPNNERAARALVDIYRRGEKWNRLSNTLEIVLDHTQGKEERVAVMDELRDISATQMNNRALAYSWAARAFAETPHDTAVRETLEEAAALADMYAELVEVYREHLPEFEGDDRLVLQRHVAALALERLGAVDDAVSDYTSILEDHPGDEGALAALEELYRKYARWEDLINIYEKRIALADDDAEKRELISEIAHLYEDGMDRPEMAEERYRAVLKLFPDDLEALTSLERLVRVSENWDALTEILLLQRDVGVIEEAKWRDITFQLGLLFNERLGNRDEAIDRYCELLDRYPGDEQTIKAMEPFLRDEETRVRVATILQPHLLQSENWRRLAWVLAILAEDTEDASQRLELQIQLAEVYADKLDDRRVAFETLGAALREHPDNMALWDKMTDVAGECNLLPELAERFQAAYQSGKLDEVSELALAVRLAELFESELGRPKSAIPYHRKIFEQDPSAEGSFSALETWYTGREHWDDLLTLYQRALENNVHVYTPVELQLKSCLIYEEVKHDTASAIAAYAAVLDMEPGHAGAIHSLVALYERAEQWQDLSLMLQTQLESAANEDSVALRFRLGEIAEQHLGLPEEALEYYEQVLADDPDHLKSQEALERLLNVDELRLRVARILEHTYEQQGAAEPMTRILMIELEEPSLDAVERVDLLVRVADLRERRLGDPKGAFDALAVAFGLSPDHSNVHQDLARLALENGLSEPYTSVLGGAIPVAMEEDPMLAAELMAEVARLYDVELGDVERAEKAYRNLLDFDRDNPETALPAITALERILSGAESWEGLLDIWRIKADLTTDLFERKTILFQMTQLEESVLGRSANAVALFREVLDNDDSDMDALLGLERLYEQERNWPEMIEILKRRVVLEEAQDVRRELFMRIATMYEDQIGDVTEAIATYVQIGEEIGPDTESFGALVRLYQQTERWSDLLDVYEAEEQVATTDAERADFLFKMGDLLRDKLDDPEQAVSRLGEVIRIDAAHGEARQALERMFATPVGLDAIHILRPLYEADENHEQLIVCDEIEADETDDPDAKVELLLHAAKVAEIGLEQYDRAFHFLGKAFRDGSATLDLGRIIDHLERLASIVERNGELVALYREIAPDILDGELQVRCNLRVAQIAQSELDELDLAREYYVKVLDIDGENAVAMDALEGIYEARGQFSELFEIYRRKSQYLGDEAARCEVLFKQARVCEEYLEDISGATSIYETILDSDFENRQAMEALERLYPKSERWTDLMELLERRAEIDEGERADHLSRLGKLAEEKLSDYEQALEYYSRALEIDASHGQTLAALEAWADDEALRGRVAEILAPGYKAAGDWTKLVGAYEARLESCDDSIERKELLRQIGTLYEEQLGSLESAFATFARLFKEDIEDKASWEVLTRLVSVLELWSELAQVYEDVLDDVVGDTPTTAELAFVLGEIYERRLHQPKEATRAYRRTLAFAPDDPNAFLAVERMLLETDSWADLLDLYRDASDAAVESDRRKDYLFKIAEIYKSVNEDLDAAIGAYQDVLDIDMYDAFAIVSLDELYRQAGRFEDLATHLRMQIDQAEDAQTRNVLRCRLGQVYRRDLEDLSTSVDVYEEALHETSGGTAQALSALEHLILEDDQRQRIADILEPLYRESDEWKKLIVILRVQVEYVENPNDKAEKYREIAEIHGSRGQNFLLAFEATARAYKAHPQDRDVLSELVRLAEGNENWEELVKVLSEVLEEIYDYDMKVDVLHLLGSTYDHHLDMPRKAISAYQAILEINDSDLIALDALEGLFNLIGDWEGLVDLLSMKVNFVVSASDRAELLRTKASIQEDLMSAPSEAIDSYRQALEADPDHVGTLEALERLYANAEEWFELVEMKRQRASLITDEEERFGILRAIAGIYEQKLDDVVEAIGAWNGVLEQNPQDAIALKALDKLYQSESMFSELLDNLRAQRELFADQAMVVEIGFRIGSLQEHQLSDLEGAIESYGDVLLHQPTHVEAIEALERLARDESFRAQAIEVIEPLHREAGRWDRLVDLLELKIALMDDPEERLEELLIIAEIHEKGRSDPRAAFTSYARALETEPSRGETLQALERIADAELLWGDLATVYEEQIEKVYDAEVEWFLLARLGDLRETHQKDVRGAIEAYRRALDGGATHPELLSALDRLYLSEAMWHELDEILERKLEFAESPEAVNRLKLRQGEIRERELGDVAGAITVYRDVVESTPENDEAVAALRVLLERDDCVEEIVEILTSVYEMRDEREMTVGLFGHRLRIAETDAEKMQLYQELAAYQEEVVGDLSGAFDAYSKAFLIDGTEPRLAEELERLAGTLGAWTALVETAMTVLENQGLDVPAAVDLGLRVAEWASIHVGDPVRAENLYRSVLEKEPEQDVALKALDDLLRNQGKFEELLPVMQQRAEAIYDFTEKKELYMSMAEIARGELGDLERAKAAYHAVRELDEADLDAIDALIALHQELGDTPTTVEYCLSRAEYTTSPAEANRYRHRAAELYVKPLADSERAMEVYREVLDTDPEDRDAGDRLERLYEQAQRWADLSDLLLQRLDVAGNDADRVGIYKQLATLQEEHFEDPDGAIGQLNEVLLIDPGDEDAPQDLERLYTKTDRWQDLVEMLEVQADRAQTRGDRQTELGLLTRIGLIWDERLEDPDRATAIYERVLEQNAEHTGALAALARLYEAAADWQRCAEVLHKAAQAGGGGPDDAEVHFRLARLHQAQMDDEAKAVEELRIAVTLDPGHVEANQALMAFCREQGDHQGLLEAKRREEEYLKELGPKVSTLLEIAELQFGPIADPVGAVASLEKARELAPDDKDVLLKLSDAYLDSGRQDDAIPVIELLIDAETAGGKKRSRKAAVYHQRLAKAYLARGDREKGLEHLEGAYKLDISNMDVLISLGQLYYEREEYEKAVKLFRALLLQRFDPATAPVAKADIYWYVGDISLKQGDKRKAKGMFQRGLDEDRDHEKCKAGLAECS